MGLVYFKTKDYIKAIDYFQQAIDINDGNIYAHFYIGNIYKEMGDLESAKISLKKLFLFSLIMVGAILMLRQKFLSTKTILIGAIEDIIDIELNQVEQRCIQEFVTCQLLAKKKNLIKQSVLCKTDWQIATNLEICTILQPIFTK